MKKSGVIAALLAAGAIVIADAVPVLAHVQPARLRLAQANQPPARPERPERPERRARPERPDRPERRERTPTARR
mgnify:CR=1 FL=1